MGGFAPINTIKLYQEAIRRAGRDGLSMRLRLFGFLLLFLNIIMVGVLVILFATGVFQTGLKEHKTLLQNELAHLSQDVYRSFGAISVQAVELSSALSANLERRLKEQDVEAYELTNHPELLEQLLDGEIAKLIGALEKTKSSGVFIMLDATVNPELPSSENSRACVYLKNMEPNIVSGLESNLRYLYGPMALARNNGIYVLPQWKMEFNTTDGDYFHTVMQTARDFDLPASRLYYWSNGMVLPYNSEKVMLCSAPIIASDGTVMGVCGFEVSEMLFKLSNMPDNSVYDYLFYVLSPLRENDLMVSGALLAGSNAAYPSSLTDGSLTIYPDDRAFSCYRQSSFDSYSGLHQEVMLYPEDSAYRDERWSCAVMMPESVLLEKISARTSTLLLGLALLMGLDIVLSAFISRRYIRPVVQALESLKSTDISSAAKTKIPEIDDLIDFLRTQDERTDREHSQPVLAQQEQSSLFQDFVRNIDTLSIAERAVFDLYMEGHTAKEIADILCLSINTIKTHNRRIYMKLNVSSRKELMVYIQMMEEANSKNAQT